MSLDAHQILPADSRLRVTVLVNVAMYPAILLYFRLQIDENIADWQRKMILQQQY